MRKTSILAATLAMALGGIYSSPSVNPVSINPTASPVFSSNGKVAPQKSNIQKSAAMEERAAPRVNTKQRPLYFSSINKVSQQKRRKYARQKGVYA